MRTDVYAHTHICICMSVCVSVFACMCVHKQIHTNTYIHYVSPNNTEDSSLTHRKSLDQITNTRPKGKKEIKNDKRVKKTKAERKSPLPKSFLPLDVVNSSFRWTARPPFSRPLEGQPGSISPFLPSLLSLSASHYQIGNFSLTHINTHKHLSETKIMKTE